MTDLHSKLLDMLMAFHELCQKEGLRYYLQGGTALGAARHKGFIPWDDDIDVGMPRSDYEKLKEISASLDTGIYCFEFPSNDKTFVYAFGKMYDTSTTLIENTRYKVKRGICIDIFPLDGAGNTFEESLVNFKAVNKKINLLLTKACAWRKGRKLYKNLALLAMRCVPEFIIDSSKLKSDIDSMCKKLSFDECDYVANYNGAWHEKEIIKKEWYGTPTEYLFEGIKVYAAENIDAYLTSLYGDWRTPPPPEKQVTHHDYLYLSLNDSYKK